MPEEKPAAIVTGALSGWLKALLTSALGLLSGAVIMYLTPLVNNAIKPPKPVANFASQISGLTVSFNNRSTGGTQGWWDFGDGTALEPFDPKLDIVIHTYAKAGTYSVKLSLQNLLGDDNDRTATVSLDNDSAPKADIAAFALIPFTPGERVPAVYRLQARVKSATHCVLSLGDDRPMEIIDDASNLDRFLTFNEMGAFTVRFAAINGKQIVEKTQTIYLGPNDSSDPMAKLVVSYEAVRVQKISKDVRVYFGWNADVSQTVTTFRKERPADLGCTISSAELVNKTDPNGIARNVSLTIAPDRKSFVVAGELVRPTGALAPNTAAPSWLAEVKLVMEKRSPPRTISPADVMMTVSLGKKTIIPMQPLSPGFEVVKKNVSLELWDGTRKAWECDKAVAGAPVTIKNQACFVTATPQSDGFALKIDAPSVTVPSPSLGPIRKVGFEFNPLLPKKSK